MKYIIGMRDKIEHYNKLKAHPLRTLVSSMVVILILCTHVKCLRYRQPNHRMCPTCYI